MDFLIGSIKVIQAAQLVLAQQGSLTRDGYRSQQIASFTASNEYEATDISNRLAIQPTTANQS